jgi:hypothetical protein
MLLKRIVEEWMLYEGLEVTHELIYSIDYLNRWWNLDGKISFEERNKFIRMVVHDPIDKKTFDNILKWINNLGYFPSHISKSKYSLKYDYDNAIHFIEKGNVAIYFDAKYDVEINENKLPKYAYHISPFKNENKILKIGLVPKSKEKISKHPERIYLANTVDGAENLSFAPSFARTNNQFTIFQVDLDKLKKHRKIRYFLDPAYDKGFYTYENIPPKYLEVVKRINI